MIPIYADAIPDWLDSFLLWVGFHGIAGDGCECIYVPWATVIILTVAFIWIVGMVLLLIAGDRERVWYECHNNSE